MAIAAARTGNVIIVSGGAGTVTLDEQLSIDSLKYIGAATSSAKITAKDSSVDVWEESASTNVWEEHDMLLKQGATVTITGTARLYIYLSVC